MARSSRTRSRSDIVTINFKGIEGKRPLVAPGEYSVRVVEVSKEKGDEADYFAWVFEIFDNDKYDGAKLYNNTSLSKKSLWNLMGMLTALGIEVPDDELDIDLKEMIDLEMLAVVDHEEYKGKPQARIVDFDSLEDKPKKGDDKKGRRGRDDDEEEKPKRRGRNDDADDDKPRRGGRSRRDEPEPMTQDEVNDLDQDGLEDVNKKYGLKLDLDELKTLRKMKSAVIDALEEEKLLKDD